MANLTPWQFLLWLAAAMMIAVPLLGILATVVTTAYYKAKEQFVMHVMTVISKGIGAAAEAFSKGMEGKMSNGGNGTNKTNDSNPNS